MFRRTKIIATLGPATQDKAILEQLISSGVDAVRINFSHANSSAVSLIQTVKDIAKQLNKPIAIMADLQGPKIRIGHFARHSVTLVTGQSFILDCVHQDLIGSTNEVYVAYPDLIHELVPGDHLMLNDGLIELEVQQIEQGRITCLVIEGGPLSDLKGLNKKGGGLAARSLTEKDRHDLKTALQAEVDYVCLSFVKDAQDIREARQLIADWGLADTAIIAKIERCEALAELEEIIAEADAIMVARGDLGVEVEAAEIPALQKKIIDQTRCMDKMVITATQMMESMITNPLPTRAEVSDVANAVLDGTDAVMLSAETASGQHPIKVIQMVNKTCLSAEKHAGISYRKENPLLCQHQRIDHAIAQAAVHAANHFPIQAIVTLTESGATALWISRQHSRVPIIAVSANQRTVNRLSLVNNVLPLLIDFHHYAAKDIHTNVLSALLQKGYLQPQGHVLLTRGTHIGIAGGTNSMEIISL